MLLVLWFGSGTTEAFRSVLLSFGMGVGGLGGLPFIPSGCSGSSISSVKGSVFSRALSSLVEQPEPTRRQRYSSGETGEKRRGEGTDAFPNTRVGQLPLEVGAIIALRPVSCMASSSDLLPSREGLKSDCADFAGPTGTF